MKNLVDQGMREGAFGLCSGLRYVPGSYAQTSELIELCKVVAKYGGIYTSHIRSEGDRGSWAEAVEEAIEIGRRSGVSVQISHLKGLGRRSWGQSPQILRMIDRAREEGIEVTSDQYPYSASSTGLIAFIPAWSHESGIAKFFERLKTSNTRDKIKNGIEESVADRGGPEAVVV